MTDFDSQWDVASEKVLASLGKAKAQLVRETFEVLQSEGFTPVKTGAYRSQHAILSSDGEVLYEKSERSGPDEIIQFDGSIVFGPHNLNEVEASVKDTGLKGVTIINDRFYAELLENGDYTRPAQKIFERTADFVEAFPLFIEEEEIA